MKPSKTFSPKPHDSAGRSLVEVMIALTIGMLLLVGITSLFVANRQTFRATDEKAIMDQEGRLALSLMAFHVRMAGYGTLLSTNESFTNSQDNNKKSPATYTDFGDQDTGVAAMAIFGCANGFADSSMPLGALGCASGTGSDAFLVRYSIDQRTVAANGALATDCLGANVPLTPAILASQKNNGTEAFYLIENRFFVQINGVTGNPELYCTGNGRAKLESALNAPQPIAENVQEMRIIYGISGAPPDPDLTVDPLAPPAATGQTVERFKTADQVLATEWDKVISARICIIVRSASSSVATQKQSYRNCDDTLVSDVTDRRLRTVFSTTVTIRNRAIGVT